MNYEYKTIFNTYKRFVLKDTLRIFHDCVKCGRKLKTDTGKTIGLGSVCRKKYAIRFTMIPLFEGELREYALDKIDELDLDIVVEFDDEDMQVSRKNKQPPYDWKDLESHSNKEELLQNGEMILNLVCNDNNEYVEHNLYGESWPPPKYYGRYETDPKFIKDWLLMGQSKRLQPAKEVIAETYDEPDSPGTPTEITGDVCILETSLYDMLHGAGEYSDPYFPWNHGNKFQRHFAEAFAFSGYGENDWPEVVNMWHRGTPMYRPILSDWEFGEGFILKEDDEYYYEMKMWNRIAHEHLEAHSGERLGKCPYYYWMFQPGCDQIYAEYPVKNRNGKWERTHDTWSDQVEGLQVEYWLEERYSYPWSQQEERFEWLKEFQQVYLDNIQMTTPSVGG